MTNSTLKMQIAQRRAETGESHAADRRCIYCLDVKPISEFNREHVIPQAFGTFDTETAVLECVCAACNTAFGKELDEKLARDSLEALDRVAVGLKKAAKFQTLGPRSTMHVEFDVHGPLRGALGFHVPDPTGSQELAVSPMPQIGFSVTQESDVVWFRFQDNWTKDDVLKKLGVERGTHVNVHTWGVPPTEAQDELEKRGFSRGTLEREIQPPSGRVATQIVGRITDVDLRAISKVAFNYLAFIAGPEFVLSPAFNDIRRYVLFGARPPWSPVAPRVNPWLIARADETPLVGHYVVIRTRGAEIECDVSLLMRTRYRVKLAVGGFLIPVAVNAGHLFDVEARRAHRIDAGTFPID